MSQHIPVMLPEVVSALAPGASEIYVDGTFGAGGYTCALLGAAQCKVYAIDRDPNVESIAKKLSQEYAGRFCFLAGNFGMMLELLAEKGIEKVDGIVLDIGVSSMQIDTKERGFSFRFDADLDMRMSCEGQSAADIVNRYEEEELANILYNYGEERKSRAIAKAIVAARLQAPINRTKELADIVRRVVRGGKDGIDPATRTFQALRIMVNDELGELEQALQAAETLLNPGGRLVVVTFHSLEDRIVKRFFQSRSGETRGGSRHLPSLGNPMTVADRLPTFFLHSRKPVLPSASELSTNPRARSAKMRVGVRSQAV